MYYKIESTLICIGKLFMLSNDCQKNIYIYIYGENERKK